MLKTSRELQIQFSELNSPLTKSGSADSLRLWRLGRVIGDGDGAVGGGSGRPDGDVGGDAALAGTRVLRPVAGAASDLARFDRKRKGKTLSNTDWKSPTDPEAKIARMKDGTTHLAYKPEHAVDLDTGVVVAAPIHSADEGDTTTLSPTLEAAACNLAEVWASRQARTSPASSWPTRAIMRATR